MKKLTIIGICMLCLVPITCFAGWTAVMKQCYTFINGQSSYCYVDIKNPAGAVVVSDMVHGGVAPTAIQQMSILSAIAHQYSSAQGLAKTLTGP
jgi:hypothetical protein